MIKVLGIDFESQDDQATTTNITEVGAILAEINGDKVEILESYSTLVYDPTYPPQSDFIVELTGITDDALKAEGVSPAKALAHLMSRIHHTKPDFFIAHN